MEELEGIAAAASLSLIAGFLRLDVERMPVIVVAVRQGHFNVVIVKQSRVRLLIV